MQNSRQRIFRMQRMLLQQGIKMTILYLPSTAASAVALNMDELQYGAHLTLELKKTNPTAVCVPATMRWDRLVNREAGMGRCRKNHGRGSVHFCHV